MQSLQAELNGLFQIIRAFVGISPNSAQEKTPARMQGFLNHWRAVTYFSEAYGLTPRASTVDTVR